MCAQKLTDATLIYRTVPKTKTSKMKKTKKQTDMLRRNGAAQETIESGQFFIALLHCGNEASISMYRLAHYNLPTDR